MNGLNPGKYTPSSPICTEPFSSKYTVKEDIGRGKFAVVRRCVNINTGEVVAAKVIRKRRKGKSCREEILREVVMLELAMAHPRLVSLREVFETQSELILVTEYCSGGELFDECVIKESFKEDDVRRLLAQILEGLAFLHDNNIVHLDLKPQNILLTKPFPEGEIKICDLGFACLTNTGEDIRDIIGTPDYVAPEVLDYEPLNIQTDMWSLGVLTYVMLTACSPFVGDTQQETFCNITQVKLDFPEDLFGHINPLAQDFISKLLVKRPRDRLTARQCFDHPWLKDLQNTMSLNVPVSDHSEELANEMVIPSNWHMSPDRRSSISTTDSLPIDRSSFAVDGQKISLTNFLPDTPETRSPSLVEDTDIVGETLSDSPIEDKDLISRTLSHIDIDRRSIDRSSSASFETCPEAVDGLLNEVAASAASTATDTCDSLPLTTSSSSTSADAVCKFVSELVHCVASEASYDTMAESSSANPVTATEELQTSPDDPTHLHLTSPDVQADTSSATNTSFSEVAVLRDSCRPAHPKNRMSMEIPHKKAKCIELMVEECNDTKRDKLQTIPGLAQVENTAHELEPCNEVPQHSHRSTEEIRNAV